MNKSGGLTVLRDGLNNERYFYERESGRSFRRVTGAIVWPFGELPGCIIILGEIRGACTRLNDDTRLVIKLAEYQNASVSELTDMLVIMGKKWKLDYFITATSDRRVYLLDNLNDSLRMRREPKIRYGDPQGWQGQGEGLLTFYHALVQRRTMDRKTLILNGGRCADELGKMEFDDIGKSILQFPSAAALCFALAELDVGKSGRHGYKLEDGPADRLGGY